MRDKYLDNLDKEIEKINSRVEGLMDILDEELKPSERMEFGIRLMAHKVKLLELRKSSELAVPENREKELMMAWMMHLRGEVADG